MHALRAMIRKEFIHIQRDPQLIGFIVVLPILLLLLFGFALRLTVEHVDVAVLDLDQNFVTASLKDKLRQDGRLLIKEVESEAVLRERLRTGEARVGILIPKDFGSKVLDKQEVSIRVLIDGTMPTLAQAAIHGVKELTGPETRADLEMLMPAEDDKPVEPARVGKIDVDQTVLYNEDLRDSDFFLPGTIGIVIMLVVLTLSIGLVREKEQQTIEQLLATPITPAALVPGKMIPYGIIAFGDFIMVAILTRVIFHLPFRGSLILIGVLGILFILSHLALGAVISTLSRTQLQASFLSMFVMIPSVLLSGFVFPIEAMPVWLQPVAWSLPMTYFMEAVRDLLLKAAPLADVYPDFLALIGFIVGLTAVSLLRFQKTLA